MSMHQTAMEFQPGVSGCRKFHRIAKNRHRTAIFRYLGVFRWFYCCGGNYGR